MKLKSSSGKEYEISDITDLDIDSVVAEREYLVKARTAEKWVGNVVESFDRRIRFLDSLIVREFLRHYEKKKVSKVKSA